MKLWNSRIVFFSLLFLITVSWHRITLSLLIWRSVSRETDIVFTAQFTGRSFNGFDPYSLTHTLSLSLCCLLFHRFERWHCIDSLHSSDMYWEKNQTNRSRNIRCALLPTARHNCHYVCSPLAHNYSFFPSLSPYLRFIYIFSSWRSNSHGTQYFLIGHIMIQLIQLYNQPGIVLSNTFSGSHRFIDCVVMWCCSGSSGSCCRRGCRCCNCSGV